MYFIHTFGLRANISREDFLEMKREYGTDSLKWINDKERYMLNKYVRRGVRLSLRWRDAKDLQRDRRRPWRMDVIVTPHKLLREGERMGGIEGMEEWWESCEALFDIIKDVEDDCGIRFKKRLKIRRVDVTVDVATPSERYSREVIRLAKRSSLPRGYRFWIPTKEQEREAGWSEKDSAMFYNHSRELEAKIYNKAADLRKLTEREAVEDGPGLLRFELTLKRGFLKRESVMGDDDLTRKRLPTAMDSLCGDAERLISKTVIGALWSGQMMSRGLQREYIRKSCGPRSAKIEKMWAYAECANRGTVEEYGTYKARRKAEKYFAEIDVSPLWTSQDCPYVPSFKDLIAGTYSEDKLDFAKRHTHVEKEYWK